MDKHICLFLLPNLFIILLSITDDNYNIHELIEFDRLLINQKNNNILPDMVLNTTSMILSSPLLPDTYKGILIFMDGENFSHYYAGEVNLNNTDQDMDQNMDQAIDQNMDQFKLTWQMINYYNTKSTELNELFKLLGLELDNLELDSSDLVNSDLISTIQKKIDEDGIYSSYKVKYDYDFDTHVYKSYTNINSDLQFLINVFKNHILMSI